MPSQFDFDVSQRPTEVLASKVLAVGRGVRNVVLALVLFHFVFLPIVGVVFITMVLPTYQARQENRDRADAPERKRLIDRYRKLDASIDGKRHLDSSRPIEEEMREIEHEYSRRFGNTSELWR